MTSAKYKHTLSNLNFVKICQMIFVSLMTGLSGQPGGRLDQGRGGALRPDPVQVRKYIGWKHEIAVRWEK